MVMYKEMLLLPTDLKDIILEQLKVQGKVQVQKSQTLLLWILLVHRKYFCL